MSGGWAAPTPAACLQTVPEPPVEGKELLTRAEGGVTSSALWGSVHIQCSGLRGNVSHRHTCLRTWFLEDEW